MNNPWQLVGMALSGWVLVNLICLLVWQVWQLIMAWLRSKADMW